MREELLGPKVENVAVAVIQELGEENEIIYNTYLMNHRDDIMEGIIITSTGYGENASTGERVKTATTRHCIELMLPNEVARIEPLMEELFAITNEYWVSFWVDDIMYDKKFIFLAETIQNKNLKMIEGMNKLGIIIR